MSTGPFPALCLLAAALPLLAASVPPLAGAAYPPASPVDPLRWGYREWVAMEPPEREAFLSGFLAGAAWTEADGPEDADRADVAAVRLRREGRLSFGLAPNVYLVRVADYYFWENHRPHRLARALVEVARALSPGGPAPGPTGGDTTGIPRPSGARPGGAADEPVHPPGPDDPLGVDGRRFLAWPTEEQRAFAAGLAVGAAAARALAGPGELEVAMDRLRATGKAPLAGQPATCAGALADWYAAPERRGVPVLRTLASLRPRC